MSEAPADIEELFERWSTIAEFAASVGCGYEAARKMRARQSIAPEHWDAVVSACVAKGVDGVTVDWLARQRSRTSIAPSGVVA